MIDLIKEYIKFRKSHFIIKEQDNISHLLKYHDVINLQTTDKTIPLSQTCEWHYGYKADTNDYESEFERWRNSIDSPILLLRENKNNDTNNSTGR